MKPDSTIGMIDGTMKLDDSLFVYRIEYSDKIGEKHHLVKTSKTIFGKKK